MAELLSHVLFAFILLTIASWFIGWLDRRWIAVGMVGAVLPDLNRIGLFVDSTTIENVIGVPFSFSAIHTLGGVLLLAAIGAMLFDSRHDRLRAYGLLVVGGVSHLFLDGLKLWADGHSGAYLYPLTWWRAPSPGWYVSADRWVVVVFLVAAGCVLIIDRVIAHRKKTI